jgi:hypothetical protein
LESTPGEGGHWKRLFRVTWVHWGSIQNPSGVLRGSNRGPTGVSRGVCPGWSSVSPNDLSKWALQCLFTFWNITILDCNSNFLALYSILFFDTNVYNEYWHLTTNGWIQYWYNHRLQFDYNSVVKICSVGGFEIDESNSFCTRVCLFYFFLSETCHTSFWGYWNQWWWKLF